MIVGSQKICATTFGSLFQGRLPWFECCHSCRFILVKLSPTKPQRFTDRISVWILFLGIFLSFFFFLLGQFPTCRQCAISIPSTPFTLTWTSSPALSHLPVAPPARRVQLVLPAGMLADACLIFASLVWQNNIRTGKYLRVVVLLEHRSSGYSYYWLRDLLNNLLYPSPFPGWIYHFFFLFYNCENSSVVKSERLDDANSGVHIHFLSVIVIWLQNCCAGPGRELAQQMKTQPSLKTSV